VGPSRSIAIIIFLFCGDHRLLFVEHAENNVDQVPAMRPQIVYPFLWKTLDALVSLCMALAVEAQIVESLEDNVFFAIRLNFLS
jgi:hypothetical protein